MLKPQALPMKEAEAFWKTKVPVSKAQFDALADQARARAFTVAGLAKMDQISAVQSAVAKALENGETLADMKTRLRPLLEKQGWTGKGAWRVENIFRTNVQSAYQAGRYAQLKRTTRLRPYWRYVAVNDSQTRPAHRALHGMVYPHNHPFWGQFYPPNGFACRCTVQSLSARQVQARGLKVQKSLPQTLAIKDPKTGAEIFVHPSPDKGWSGNIGENWSAGLGPSELSAPLKDSTAVSLCRKNNFAEHNPCAPPLADLDPVHIYPVDAKDILPKGLSNESYVKSFLQEFGLKDINASTVHSLPGRIPVVVSKDFFIDKKTGAWKVQKSGREQYMKLLARTIKEPYEVWRVPATISGRPVTVLRCLRLFQPKGKGKIGGFAVFNLVQGRKWKAATTFTPKTGKEAHMLKYLEGQRKGELLYREKPR